MCCGDTCLVQQCSEAILAQLDPLCLGRKLCFPFLDTPVLYHPTDKWFANQPVKAVGYLIQVQLSVCLTWRVLVSCGLSSGWCCWSNHC